MAMKFRYHLIIACAIALTFGGAFAAWQFGNIEPQEAELETSISSNLPAERWSFDSVQVTFLSGDHGDFGIEDEVEKVEKQLSTANGRQITYETYETLNLNVDEGYLFTGWFNEDGDPFEIDIIRNNEDDEGNPINEVYTAQYIQLTDGNKATTYSLYDYNDNLLGTFIDNPGDTGTQMIIYNVKTDVHKKTDDETEAEAKAIINSQKYYIKNHDDSYEYVIDATTNYNYWDSSELIYSEGDNNVKSGIYYVIFDKQKSSEELGWHAHGGHVFFNRLYQYSIVGDPSNTWDSSAENLVTFGYQETIKESPEPGSREYKVYKADNVFFDKDCDFEFKLNEADDYPYLDGITVNFNSEYIKKSSETTNFYLNTTNVGEHDYYMMTMYINVYENKSLSSAGRIYNEPYEVYLSATIKKYDVRYYRSTTDTNPEVYKVEYNSNFPTCTFEGNNEIYKTWYDVHTNEVIDMSHGVIQDYYIYPYEILPAVSFYNGDTLLGKYALDSSGHITDEAVSELDNPATPHTDYTFAGWRTEGGNKFDLSNETELEANRYDAVFENQNVLRVVNPNNTNAYLYLQGEESDTTITWVAGGNSEIAYGTYDYYLDSFTQIIAKTPGRSGKYIVTYNGSSLSVKNAQDHIYLKPNSNWLVDGARFAARFWTNNDGSDEKWMSMSLLSGEGIYFCYIPNKNTSTDTDHTKVIFCRMNGSTTTNSWANKWNQSGDLTVPTGNNLFTVPSGSWDGATTAWSVYNGSHTGYGDETSDTENDNPWSPEIYIPS